MELIRHHSKGSAIKPSRPSTPVHCVHCTPFRTPADGLPAEFKTVSSRAVGRESKAHPANAIRQDSPALRGLCRPPLFGPQRQPQLAQVNRDRFEGRHRHLVGTGEAS
jgi:hypothetical protein